MPDPSISVSFVERYGAFGVLVLIAGWVCWWVAPRVIQAFRDQSDLYRQELAAERESREKMHAACDDSHKANATAIQAAVAAMQAISGEVKRLAEKVDLNRTAEHAPLPPPPPPETKGKRATS